MDNVADRVYDLTKPEDVVELANAVQIKVYWGSHFVDETDENVQYNHFWDYCSAAVAKGCTKVKITEYNEVYFIQ